MSWRGSRRPAGRRSPGSGTSVSSMQRPGDQERDGDDRVGHDRDQQVAEHVDEQHVAGADALGAGRADVVGPDLLQGDGPVEPDAAAEPAEDADQDREGGEVDGVTGPRGPPGDREPEQVGPEQPLHPEVEAQRPGRSSTGRPAPVDRVVEPDFRRAATASGDHELQPQPDHERRPLDGQRDRGLAGEQRPDRLLVPHRRREPEREHVEELRVQQRRPRPVRW